MSFGIGEALAERSLILCIGDMLERGLEVLYGLLVAVLLHEGTSESPIGLQLETKI